MLLVLVAESIHPSAGEEFIEKRYSVRWKRQQERQMQRYVRQELYGQALKTSEILVKALDEVRRVSCRRPSTWTLLVSHREFESSCRVSTVFDSKKSDLF